MVKRISRKRTRQNNKTLQRNNKTMRRNKTLRRNNKTLRRNNKTPSRNNKSKRRTNKRYKKKTRGGMQGVGEQVEEETPPYYMCPITKQIMEDPVIDPEGNSYEKYAIKFWLTKNSTSPITRNPLTVDQLVPNRALQDAIQEWKAAAPAPAAHQSP